MVAEREENLCLLVEEAGDRGVIDTACSKTVAGGEWVTGYIQKLTEKGVILSINLVEEKRDVL